MLLSLQALEEAVIPLPEVLEFAAANAGPPVDMNDVEAFRSLMKAAVAAVSDTLPPAYDILETDIDIPMRDGYKAVAKVRKPQDPSAGGCPLIVLVFGGGWVAGDKEQMAVEARALVRAFSAVVVNISYRLAPEHKFPTGCEDSWDNLVWLTAHAPELGADPSKGFLIGGTSAGAGIAAVCARKAQLEPIAFPLTGQWLNCPSILSYQHIPEKWKHLYISLKQNEHAPIFPAAALDILQKQTCWDMDSPWRSPMSSKHSLAGLPKAYIQVDGMDCLRDDGLIYDEMLNEAGVETRCDLYVGCPHAHATFVPGIAMEKAQIDMVKNFGWMLGCEVEEREAQEALGLM